MNLAVKRIIKALLIPIAILLTVVAIFSFPRLGWKVWGPNWSPAGDLIAFRCVFISPDKWNYDSFYLHDWSDICVTDQNGKRFRVLTSGGNVSDFSWSPDGQRLAWAHESDFVWESISIWNSHRQTIETFPLSEKIDWLSNLKWSKDAQEIYLEGSGAVFDIVREKLALLPKQEVDGTKFFDFTRSSDGEYLALSRHMIVWGPDLVITKNEKPVYVGYEAGNSSIYSWSPVANILAWSGASVPKDSQNPEKAYYDVLFLTDASTGETIKYEATADLFFNFSGIFWSSDGTRLAILDTGYDPYVEIIVFEQSDHGFPLSIAQHFTLDLRASTDIYPYVHRKLSWSPDGHHFIFDSDYQLWLVNVQNSETQEFLIDFPYTFLLK